MKKTIFAVLLIACFVSVAVAADNHNYLAAGPGVIPGSPSTVHPFVNVPATEAAATIIFGSDYEDNAVWWFNPKGKELGAITSGLVNPQGLATDADANLYIANTGASEILIYKKPYTKTPKTLSASGWYPVGVAQSDNGKWVAATNIFSTSGTAGSVLLYKKGKLVATVSNSTFFYYYFCGFDKSGNLFIDGRDSNGNTLVGEIPGATKGKTTLNVLTTGNSIEFPGGIQVTTKNKIAIDDQDAFAVYTYKQPKAGSLGSPVATTSLSGVGDAVTFAFTSTNKDLWEADAVNLNLAKYAYPKGGSAIGTISPSGAALPIGVAIVPAEQP